MTGGIEDVLTLDIMRRLEIDWQWVGHFDPTDADGIANARAAGRRAGRALKVKVVTFQTDPSKREDGKVVVMVSVNQEMDPVDKARMNERSRLLIEKAFGRR